MACTMYQYTSTLYSTDNADRTVASLILEFSGMITHVIRTKIVHINVLRGVFIVAKYTVV